MAWRIDVVDANMLVKAVRLSSICLNVWGWEKARSLARTSGQVSSCVLWCSDTQGSVVVWFFYLLIYPTFTAPRHQHCCPVNQPSEFFSHMLVLISREASYFTDCTTICIHGFSTVSIWELASITLVIRERMEISPFEELTWRVVKWIIPMQAVAPFTCAPAECKAVRRNSLGSFRAVQALCVLPYGGLLSRLHLVSR